MQFSFDLNSWLEAECQDMSNYDIKLGTIIGPNFKVLKRLGSGSFGQIFLGQSLNDQDTKVAIKFEPYRGYGAQLYNEMRIYQILGKDTEGFPKMYWFGQCDKYNVLIIELLGKNLEEVFQLCDQTFSIKTILYLALQLLNRFEDIHNKNIVYRDVKPENFLLGCEGAKQNIIHIVDFGLSKEFIDVTTGQHIPFREGKNLTGTARYMSINAHLGIEQSRRDDLESLGYLFVYFLRRGKLPWSGIKASTLNERYRKIRETKQAMPLEELCKGFPQEFADFLIYDRNLRFDQQPDYEEWKVKFSNLFHKYNDKMKYEWENKIN